jgi:hypothetical protein
MLPEQSQSNSPRTTCASLKAMHPELQFKAFADAMVVTISVSFSIPTRMVTIGPKSLGNLPWIDRKRHSA